MSLQAVKLGREKEQQDLQQAISDNASVQAEYQTVTVSALIPHGTCSFDFNISNANGFRVPLQI